MWTSEVLVLPWLLDSKVTQQFYKEEEGSFWSIFCRSVHLWTNLFCGLNVRTMNCLSSGLSSSIFLPIRKEQRYCLRIENIAGREKKNQFKMCLSKFVTQPLPPAPLTEESLFPWNKLVSFISPHLYVFLSLYISFKYVFCLLWFLSQSFIFLSSCMT